MAEFEVDGNRGFPQLLNLLKQKNKLPFPGDVGSLAGREVLLLVTGSGAKHTFVLLGMCFLKDSFRLQ